MLVPILTIDLGAPENGVRNMYFHVMGSWRALVIGPQRGNTHTTFSDSLIPDAFPHLDSQVVLHRAYVMPRHTKQPQVLYLAPCSLLGEFHLNLVQLFRD